MNSNLELIKELKDENVKLKQALANNFVSECEICLSYNRIDDWRECDACDHYYCKNCVRSCEECGGYYCESCLLKKFEVPEHNSSAHRSKCRLCNNWHCQFVPCRTCYVAACDSCIFLM